MNPSTPKPVAPPIVTLAQFNRLSKRAQRVAIAKDVLARLKSRQFKSNGGRWAIIDSDKAGSDTSLQTYVNEGKHCSVCALGAAMCSYAGIANKIELKRDVWCQIAESTQDWDPSIERRLTRHFPKRSLIAIELAYENGEGAYCYPDTGFFQTPCGLPKTTIARIQAFVKRFPDKARRFRAIYENVIRHGDFTP